MIRFRRHPDTVHCREVGRRLQSFLDGEDTAGRAELIRAHLEECRRCGLAAETYRALIAALARRAEPLPTEPVERLRSFGRALAAGRMDPGGPAAGAGP
jgi:anti-sigma factor RsiW